MMYDLGFLSTDYEVKIVGDSEKAVHTLLHLGLCDSILCVHICKQKVMRWGLFHLDLSLLSEEKHAISPEFDLDASFILTVEVL